MTKGSTEDGEVVLEDNQKVSRIVHQILTDETNDSVDHCRHHWTTPPGHGSFPYHATYICARTEIHAGEDNKVSPCLYEEVQLSDD